MDDAGSLDQDGLIATGKWTGLAMVSVHFDVGFFFGLLSGR
jgi:hypothetical protein